MDETAEFANIKKEEIDEAIKRIVAEKLNGLVLSDNQSEEKITALELELRLIHPEIISEKRRTIAKEFARIGVFEGGVTPRDISAIVSTMFFQIREIREGR